MKEFDSLKKTLEEKKIFSIKKQEENISEDIMNENFKKIDSELKDFFEIANTINKKIKNEKMLLAKKSKEKNKNIEDFKSQIKKIKILRKEKEMKSKGIYEDFKYHDYESILENEAMKKCSIENGELKLPIKRKIDAVKNEFGKYNCEVKINLFNGEIIKEESSDVKSVFTDDEYDFFNQKVKIKKDKEMTKLKKPYNIEVNGAFCEIEINFKKNEKISCIELEKICKYNYDILFVFVYEGEYKYKKVYEKKENEKQSQEFFSVEFNQIEASKIKILLNQRNYEKDFFIRKEEKNNEIILKNNLEKGIYNKNELINKKEIKGTKEKNIERKVYEYGIKQIRIFWKEYEKEGYFETGKIDTPSNLKSIFLYVDHEMPKIILEKDENNLGEISYYILKEAEEENIKWKEIFPINQKEIRDEKLNFIKFKDADKEEEVDNEDGEEYDLYANLKFLCAGTSIKLKKNFKIIPSKYYGVSSDRTKIYLKKEVYDENELYVLTYQPLYSDKKIIFDENKTEWYVSDDGEIGEFFESAEEDNSITLKYEPYIDEEKYTNYNDEKGEYENVDFDSNKNENLKEDLVVFVNGVKYKNITNYANKTFETEKIIDEACFYQEGKKIIFGRRVFKERPKNIDVKYKISNKDINMRIEMKRYIKGYEALTPRISSYFLGYKRRE
jgi:hypothetical protein